MSLVLALLYCAIILSLRKEFLISLAIVIVIFIIGDLLRRRIFVLQSFVLSVFGQFMRRQELHNLSSMSWLLLGNFIIMSLFSSEIVTLSLLMLAIGDPICNIIGIKYGKDKLIGSKSFQGSIAGFIACSIVSVVYFKLMDIMTSKLILNKPPFRIYRSFR